MTVQIGQDATSPEAAGPDDAVFRRIDTQEEYDACVRMQYDIWGAGFTEVVPATILRVAQHIGGVTAGAFDSSGALLGFVFGMTGVQDGCLVHWSDLLAVRQEARDRGLGRRLKLYQRELLLPLGVRTVYWTYDPLVARNAHLNMVRLGARPVEYVTNMYGPRTHSALHSALGTDRFVVAWDLGTEPDGPEHVPGAGDMRSVAPIVNQPQHGTPGMPVITALPDVPSVRVEVPSDIQKVIATDTDAAREWRQTTRRALTWYMARGYHVTGFSRTQPDDRCYYTLAVEQP